MARPPVPLIGYFGTPKGAVLVDRFIRKVDKVSSPRGCWLWLAGAAKNVNGDLRACFRIPGRAGAKSASRLSHALFKGDVIEGALVLHTCDDGMCVNPAHLYIGTHEQNTADMMARGRGVLGTKRGPATVKRGYKRPWMARRRKLTDDAVRAIRKDGRKANEIAAQYEIAESTVYGIKNGTRKAHVKG